MATAALVDKNSIDLGRRVIAALTREGIPVAVGLWAFASQAEEWQLTIATPLVDELGPLAAYGKVQKALQKSGVEDEFPLRRVFLRSPKDRVLRLLQQESRAVGREDYRLVNASIEGSFVEEAYLYSGFIHIVETQKSASGHPSKYQLVYAPYAGPGGAARPVVIQGIEHLQDFLSKKLRIDSEHIDLATARLARDRRVSIPNVLLKHNDLRRLNLI